MADGDLRREIELHSKAISFIARGFSKAAPAGCPCGADRRLGAGISHAAREIARLTASWCHRREIAAARSARSASTARSSATCCRRRSTAPQSWNPRRCSSANFAGGGAGLAVTIRIRLERLVMTGRRSRCSARFSGLRPRDRPAPPPLLTEAVNDFAGVIDPDSKRELARRIDALKTATGDVVVGRRSGVQARLRGHRRVRRQDVREPRARQSRREQDNAVLLVAAMTIDGEDRGRHGLEGPTPTGSPDRFWISCCPISRRAHTARACSPQPRAHQQNRAGARRLVGSSRASRGKPRPVPVGTGPACLTILVVLFVLWIISRAGRRRRRRAWGGGPWSGWNSGVGPFGAQLWIRRRLLGGFGGGGSGGGGFGGFGGGGAARRRRVTRLLGRGWTRIAARRAFRHEPNKTITQDDSIMQKLFRSAAHVAVVLILALAFSGCSYNKFTSQEEAVKAQWSEIQNQLQRRNDLIDNLVATVKGYATQEREVFGQIAEARAKLAGAKTPRSDRSPNQQSAARRSAGRGREPPALKSNERSPVEDELAGTETARRRPKRQRDGRNTPRAQTSPKVTPSVRTGIPYFEAPAEPRKGPGDFRVDSRSADRRRPTADSGPRTRPAASGPLY